MKRFVLASVLAASTLWFAAPARASVPPPLPPPQASFSSGSLRVDVYGTSGKPALVFVPGLMCGAWEWAGEIERFSPRYTIYALALPGFDGQPAVSGDPFNTVSAEFWTMLQARRIDKPIVIGHSLGGTLAIMLAEQHSDRLSGVIAVDGMPIFPGMQLMPPAARVAMARQMTASIASIAGPAQLEAAEKTYSLPYMMTSPADVASVAPLTARSDPKAAAAWMQQDLTMDLRPGLASVRIPLLEIAPFDPQFDPKTPAALASASQKQAYYASLLAGDPSAAVLTIAPSRHFVMYDQPAKLDAAIASFLAGENRSRASGS